MTRLAVQVRQPGAQGVLEGGAVATARQLTDVDGELVKRWWTEEKTVAVVGSDAGERQSAEFDLPAGGTYSVQIVRPRGPAVVREFEIGEGEERLVRIELDAARHESLGWQQYAGLVSSRARVVASPKAMDSLAAVHVRRLIRDGVGAQPESMELPGLQPRLFAAETHPQFGRSLPPLYAGLPGYRAIPDVADEEYSSWSFVAPGNDEGLKLVSQLQGSLPDKDDLGSKYPRWMYVVSTEGADLASIPWSWWGGRSEGDGQIQIVYDRLPRRFAGRESRGRLTVSLHDPRWFGLLEFLASGRLYRGKQVLSGLLDDGAVNDETFDPELALYGKVKGPLVATAGAIILVAGADTNSEERWDPWVKNLSNWFPGIPDGAILWGCRRIARAQGMADIESAFEVLVEGINRGIPYFSATIRILMTSLSQIGGEIAAAEGYRRLVARLATRVDPNQVFTVIPGGEL